MLIVIFPSILEEYIISHAVLFIKSTMFFLIFHLYNFATLPNHIDNKNPFVIETEFYIKQLLQQFPFNLCEQAL
ncbi:hypothetical protein wScaTNS_01010 [Wolbachia pipientis]